MHMVTLFLAAHFTAVAGVEKRERGKYDEHEDLFTVRGDDFFVKFYDRAGWAVIENAAYGINMWDYLFQYTDSQNKNVHGHDHDYYCNGDKFLCSICSYYFYYEGREDFDSLMIDVIGDTDYKYWCPISPSTKVGNKQIAALHVPQRTTTTTITSTTTSTTTITSTATTTSTTTTTTTTTKTTTTTMTTTTTTAATTTTTTTAATTTTTTTAATTSTTATTTPTYTATAAPVCGPKTATARCTCVGSASTFCNVGETCKAGQCIHPDCTIPKDIAMLIPHAANSTCGHALSRNTSCKIACKTGYTARGSGALECGASMGRLSTVPACVAEGVKSEVVVYVQSIMSLGIYIPDSSMLLHDTFKKVIMSSVAAVVGVVTTNVVITKASLIDVRRHARVDVEFRVKASDAASQATLATAINPGNALFTTEIKTQVGIKCADAKVPSFVLSVDVQPATVATVYKPVDHLPRSTDVSTDSATPAATLTTAVHSHTTVVIAVLACGLIMLAGSIVLWKTFSPRRGARPLMNLQSECD